MILFKKKYTFLSCTALAIAFLFNATSLHAKNEVERVDVIHYYEDCGDYARALKLARDYISPSETVAYLEKKLLTVGFSMLLFDENQKPRMKLLKLLELVGMDPLDESQKTIVQINNWAQSHLLRQGERWDKQTTKFEDLKSKINPLLTDLGFIEEVPPHFTTYQGAIVHGALLPTLRLRLDYLVKQWNQGIRFTHLYFLGGERPLEPQYENKNTFAHEEKSLLKIKSDWNLSTKLPKTETEMMQLVWEQSEIPEDMRTKVEVYFINAPMKKDPKSEKLLRPNTDDTIREWLKTSPPYGSYLAISNAPYINRQDLVIRALTPNKYTFDTVGPKARKQEKMAIFLDEVARMIFQTKEKPNFVNKVGQNLN